ncbi:Na+/H+ antiporter subunit A [Nonomuraea sp. NBC_01738]|uniref:Na+/H+ antiporter subunit A n=1 Tax=Nonomuraea sp. NBC_01738 TaxID=2976003 RepID=UPI002E148CA9|nr:Na+/H+ antiporter subunit A [Nonomuraea sp. NBC_01738]
MGWLLVLHAVTALCAPRLVRWLGRNAYAVLALAPAAGFAATLAGAVSGPPLASVTEWAPALGLSLAFRADALGLLMMFLVTGVGVLVLVYCVRYFERGDGLFGAVMVGFAGVMLGLVVADDLLLLYVFWELTTVFSYLLIGSDPESRSSRRAAMQALTMTTLGGLAMLAGFIIVGEAAGTYRISLIAERPPAGGAIPVAVLLILAGALSKAAIFPFSSWLPAAMAAPTPVSAYLHAAAMVKAGIYLLARLAPVFGDLTVWRAAAVPLGLVTMLLGGWRALREPDLKKLLAFGTVSQLGFLTVLFGAGGRDAALAGVAVLLAHALFKAALFLVVGIVDHATGTRDLYALSGLYRSMPWVCAVAVLAGASMAGVVPLVGFIAKEAAFEALLGDPAVLTGIALGSVLTVAYTLRFLWGAFAVKPGLAPTPVHATAAPMFLPPALLSALGLAFAPFASWYGGAMPGYIDTFRDPGHGTHLALWSGAPVPLLLSAGALAGGALLFWAREPVARAGRWLHRYDTGHAYWAGVRALDRFAVQLTGIVQRGSLPDYLVIAMVCVVGIGVFAVLYSPGPGIDLVPFGWENNAQAGAGLFAVVTALCALGCRAYILMAVVIGMCGYGTALLFFAHGSPDLALTQFLAETLSLVLFVLVLRRLPAEPFRVSGRLPFAGRALLGAMVGIVAAGAGMLALAARQDRPVGALMPAAAERAGASNIVSTLLVDIRAWDTMGESSVLVVLTLGVTSMVFLRRRTYALETETKTETKTGTGRDGGRWLAAALPPGQRSVAFEIVARLIFHTILLLSIYLMFTGHGGVGGGFAGGIVAGLAITVRYLAGGRYELAVALPAQAGVLMGAGLTLSVATALAGLLGGGALLTMLSADLTLPLLGHLHLSTSLLFDLGVYISVLGMVQDMLRALGGELDRQIEEERA